MTILQSFQSNLSLQASKHSNPTQASKPPGLKYSNTPQSNPSFQAGLCLLKGIRRFIHRVNEFQNSFTRVEEYQDFLHPVSTVRLVQSAVQQRCYLRFSASRNNATSTLPVRSKPQPRAPSEKADQPLGHSNLYCCGGFLINVSIVQLHIASKCAMNQL